MRPRVELLVTPRTSARLSSVARLLGRLAEVHAPERSLPPPAAFLASSCHAPGLDRALASDVPVAVWVDDDADGPWRDAEVLLVSDDAHADALGAAAIVVPPMGVEASSLPAMPPFVRRRWRDLLHLPGDLVVHVGAIDGARAVSGETGRDDELPADLVDTALAVAAVAIASSAELAVRALALGTPTVVDEATAQRLGATDGLDVVVAASGLDESAAADVVGDDYRAAALSRGARRLVEARHDLGGTVRQMATRLGLSASSGAAPGAMPLLRDRLVALGTPPLSTIEQRAAKAVSGLEAR